MFGNNRGRKSEEELKTERVVVHVTELEKEKIKMLAARHGMDVSTFIRITCIYRRFNNFFKE